MFNQTGRSYQTRSSISIYMDECFKHILSCNISLFYNELSRRFWAIWYAHLTQCPEELCNRGVWSKKIIVKYTIACIDLKITLSIFDNALTFFLFTRCELTRTLFDSCLVSLWSGPALLTSYSLRCRLFATDILRKCNIYISGLRSEALTLLREQAVCHEQWQTMSHFPVTCLDTLKNSVVVGWVEEVVLYLCGEIYHLYTSIISFNEQDPKIKALRYYQLILVSLSNPIGTEGLNIYVIFMQEYKT